MSPPHREVGPTAVQKNISKFGIWPMPIREKQNSSCVKFFNASINVYEFKDIYYRVLCQIKNQINSRIS